MNVKNTPALTAAAALSRKNCSSLENSPEMRLLLLKTLLQIYYIGKYSHPSE